MKVLFIKERTHKLDVMENAILKTFSQCEDVVTIATIKVGGVLNTVSQIKELIKQYQPDVIVAKHLLASVLLFELPKTIKKILIDPYMVFEDSEDGIKLTLAFKYGSVKLFNWLLKNSTEFANNPPNSCVRNAFCILRNADTSSPLYAKWVSAFFKANNLGAVTVSKDDDIMTQLGTYHRSMTQARACQQSKYANIAALKQAFRRRQTWQKSIPYIVSAICVIVCSIFSFQHVSNKLREQQMLKTVNCHVNQEISKLGHAADTCSTYLALVQQHYPTLWEKSALVRDSIADLYADDPALRLQCIETWSLIFGERFMQFDNRIKQDKLISTK